MENFLNLSPVQYLFIFAMQAWIFVIFPVIVLRKINYLTALLEAHIDVEDDQEE